MTRTKNGRWVAFWVLMAVMSFIFATGGSQSTIIVMDMISTTLASGCAVMKSGQHESDDADSQAIYMACSATFLFTIVASITMSRLP